MGNEKFALNKQIIFCVLAVVMTLDLVSFGTYWMGQAISSGDWTRMDRNLRSEVWPEFLQEAEYYSKQNMFAVNWLIDRYLSLDRRVFGNTGPWVDYMFLKLFRAAGFVSCLAGGVVVVLFMLAEALKRNREKRLNFERRSSTVYHFVLHSGSMFSICLFSLYLFMPGKVVIPCVFEAQVPFLFCTPYPWAGVMTLIACCMVYWSVSNMAYNV